jgi:hypothetical protein
LRPNEEVRSLIRRVHNQPKVIAAFGFFKVPTLTFGVLYCFSVIEHHRRWILHFKITAHPSTECRAVTATSCSTATARRLCAMSSNVGSGAWPLRTKDPASSRSPTVP